MAPPPFTHLTLLVYKIRFNAIYSKLLTHDYGRAALLLSRYVNDSDVSILPPAIDEELKTYMFMADIFATLQCWGPCKEQVVVALMFIDRYSTQQITIAKRMLKGQDAVDDLGTLNLLPQSCLNQIASNIIDEF